MDIAVTVYCDKNVDIDDAAIICGFLQQEGLIEDFYPMGGVEMGRDALTAIVTPENKNAVVVALRSHGFNVVE